MICKAEEEIFVGGLKEMGACLSFVAQPSAAVERRDSWKSIVEAEEERIIWKYYPFITITMINLQLFLFLNKQE